MKRAAPGAFLSVLLALITFSARGDDAKPQGPSAGEARMLILQLDSSDFEIRRAASLKLNNLPGSALPAVEAALKSDILSAESRLRLETALRILKPRSIDEARQAQREAWEKDVLQNAYKQCGKTNPAYDQSINDAIEIFRGLPYEPQMNDRDPRRAKALALFKAAIAAGCDDPMIQSLCVITAGSMVMNSLPPPLNRPDPIFATFLDGNYPPAVKLMVIQRFMPCIRFLDRRKMDSLLPPLVARMCTDKTIPQWDIYIIMSQLTNAYYSHGAGMNRLAPAIAQYEKSAANLSESAIIKGFYEYLCAHELRGRGNHPSPDEQKAFEAKLAEAEKTLTAAWEADQTDSRCAAEIISVKQALGDAGDRQTMELWFKRVTDVDPGSVFAYQCKLNYLMENASREEIIAFGHECLNTQNWHAGLPFLLVQIHNRYGAEDWKKYFSNADNWKDIEEVYEGCFVNYPTDTDHRNEYVMFALHANKFDIAQRQIQILGKKSKWSFKPASRPHPSGTTQPATGPAQKRSN